MLKACLKFQHMLILCGRFQGMLKTVICVENYIETGCWKFQCVLKTVKHVENYVKISRCVENVYVRHVENHVENHVEVWKKHFTVHVEIKRQISFFKSDFAHFSGIVHIELWILGNLVRKFFSLNLSSAEVDLYFWTLAFNVGYWILTFTPVTIPYAYNF